MFVVRIYHVIIKSILAFLTSCCVPSVRNLLALHKAWHHLQAEVGYGDLEQVLVLGRHRNGKGQVILIVVAVHVVLDGYGKISHSASEVIAVRQESEYDAAESATGGTRNIERE